MDLFTEETPSLSSTQNSDTTSNEIQIEGDEKTRYEKCQHRTFLFLEKPVKRYEIAYHITNLVFVFGSIVTGVLSTIDTFESDDSNNSEAFHYFLFYYELFLLLWFSIEYVLRVWSCCVVKKYRGFYGRLRFMKSFYMAVDIFIIMSTIVTAILHVKSSYFTLLRTTRFLQVFRVLRVDRRKGDLGMMFRILYTHRKELLTCYFVGFIILFGGAYIVYILEKGHTEATITDMANGLYWALITVTSVGFGDISPVTWSGKITTGIFAIIGCAFFSLPAGILGSGFAIQVSKAKSQKKVFKIRNPAAIVIQTAWRNYAVRKNQEDDEIYEGTWKRYLPQITQTAQWPGYYDILPGIKPICNAHTFGACNVPFNQGQVMPTWGRAFQKLTSIGSAITNVKYEAAPSPALSPKMARMFNWSSSTPASSRRGSQTKDRKKSAISIRQEKYKSAIRFLLRIQFWTSIKSFKNQRYPFIEIRDIREKSTQWHIERMALLREIEKMSMEIRREIEELGKEMKKKEEDCRKRRQLRRSGQR